MTRKPDEILSPRALGAVLAAVAEHGPHWINGNTTVNVALLLEYIQAQADEIDRMRNDASEVA